MRSAARAAVLLLLAASVHATQPAVIQGAHSESSPCAFADDVDYRCSLHESTCTDLSNGVVSDKESCCELCANDPTGRCTAAVWESWPSSQRCYLKRLPHGQQLTDRRPGTVGCVFSAVVSQVVAGVEASTASMYDPLFGAPAQSAAPHVQHLFMFFVRTPKSLPGIGHPMFEQNGPGEGRLRS